METLEKEKPLAAKVKVLKEEACLMTLSVELSKDEVHKETESVFSDIQRRASLPGFRTGKAPMELVRKNFAERARQTVLENLIGRAAAQVLRDRKLRTLDTPKIEKIEFEPNKPLLFHMKIEKDPEVKAKDYKGIKVNRKSPLITDLMVQNTLDELRERNATLVASSSEALGKTHFAVIDFEGKIEGKLFPGGSAKNYLLDMSTPQTIAGFAEGLVGAKLNGERTVPVRFPADYPRKEWAGKEAAFTVTIKEIKEKKLPALDDEFAKDLGVSALAELKQKIHENHGREETAKSNKDVEDQVCQWLIDKNEFSIPPTLLEERIRSLIQRARQTLERQGLLQAKDSQADAALREKVRPQAEKDIRLSYLLRAIAAQEKLEVTDADVDALKKKALEEEKNAKPEEVENYFREHVLSIKASLTEGKVMDFLKTNAKIKVINA